MTASEGEPPLLDEENEATWALLHDQFELADGFWLGFVFSFGATAPRVLADRAEVMLRGVGRGFRRWRPARPEAMREALIELVEAAREGTTDCLWFEALAEDFGDIAAGNPWSDARSEFLMRANEKRDVFVERHRGALVLVLPPSAKVLAQERAPDLWSYREYVAELSARLPIEGFMPSLDAASRVPHTEAPLSEEDLRVVREAEEVLSRATRFSEAIVKVGRATGILVKAGRRDEVRRTLLKLLSLPRDASTTGPSVSRVFYALAAIELGQGDEVGALDHLRAAIRCCDPADTWRYVELQEWIAAILIKQRMFSAAREACEEVIARARVDVAMHAMKRSLEHLFLGLMLLVRAEYGQHAKFDLSLFREAIQVGVRRVRLPGSTPATRKSVLDFLRETLELEGLVGPEEANALRAELDAIENRGSGGPSPRANS